MTPRQSFLKLVYPLWMWFSRLGGKRSRDLKSKSPMIPPVSFYDLEAELINGNKLPFKDLKGKQVLIVNTASDCGYTPQYAELQSLHEQYRDQLVVIGFPANDFKEQEKGSDAEIAAFCSRNYGVTFPLAKKTTVIKSEAQNPVFRWLTQKELNGWNEQPPVWNFSKYLVSEEGVLLRYFDPGISPLAPDITAKLKR